jgi:hypothetical protein
VQRSEEKHVSSLSHVRGQQRFTFLTFNFALRTATTHFAYFSIHSMFPLRYTLFTLHPVSSTIKGHLKICLSISRLAAPRTCSRAPPSAFPCASCCSTSPPCNGDTGYLDLPASCMSGDRRSGPARCTGSRAPACAARRAPCCSTAPLCTRDTCAAPPRPWP